MLTPAQQKALTSVERALERAFKEIPSVSSDDDQAAAHQTLRGMQSQLEQISDVRARDIPTR